MCGWLANLQPFFGRRLGRVHPAVRRVSSFGRAYAHEYADPAAVETICVCVLCPLLVTMAALCRRLCRRCFNSLDIRHNYTVRYAECQKHTHDGSDDNIISSMIFVGNFLMLLLLPPKWSHHENYIFVRACPTATDEHTHSHTNTHLSLSENRCALRIAAGPTTNKVAAAAATQVTSSSTAGDTLKCMYIFLSVTCAFRVRQDKYNFCSPLVSQGCSFQLCPSGVDAGRSHA